jgi:hypothetical protein
MVVDFPFLWGSGCHDVPSLRCCKLLQPAGWSFCHPYMMTNVMDQFSQFVRDWGQCWVWKVRKFVRTANGGVCHDVPIFNGQKRYVRFHFPWQQNKETPTGSRPGSACRKPHTTWHAKNGTMQALYMQLILFWWKETT